MKTPLFKRTVSLLFFRGSISFLFLLSLFLVLVSCDDDKSYGRKEFLIVSETEEKEPVDNVYCKIEGGRDTLFVFSNVEYKYYFQTDDEDENWIKIISSDYLPDIDATRLIIEINPRGDDYLKRTGTLSFSSGENFLGQFVPFNQGFNTRLYEDFAWLKYGTNSPFDLSKDALISTWTETQVKYGWKSTVPEGVSEALCYGKNGYIRLGDESMGADLISPFTNGIIKDTVVLLTFDAVAFVSELGIKDKNKLTVNILDGGIFADGTSSASVDLGYYNHTDKNLPVNMWQNARYKFYIKNDEIHPFTGDTRIQFIAGADIVSGAHNRLFIDNINLFIVDNKSYYLADE